MELRGRRFLVTGASGFIGRHVVDALLAAEADEVVALDVRAQAPRERVRLLEADVRDADAVRAACTGVDGVFHLAVVPLGACTADPRLCHDVNVTGTLNVLEALRSAGGAKLVFSSASSVYGDTDETMDESHPLNARTVYGASKIAAEYYVRALAPDFVTLRYMNVYGPGQQGGLIAAVLRRLLAAEPPVIDGDGSQSFDFVHVADVADANLAAMASDVSGEVFNVGSGAEASVREIVGRLIELVGADLEPEYRPDVPVTVRRRVGSSRRAQERLGWTARRRLEDGLAELVAQYSGGR